MAIFCKPEQEEIYLNALDMAKALNKLRLARKESTQAFARASYEKDVQAILDMVERFDSEGLL